MSPSCQQCQITSNHLSDLRSAGADPTDYLVKLARDFEYEDRREDSGDPSVQKVRGTKGVLSPGRDFHGFCNKTLTKVGVC